ANWRKIDYWEFVLRGRSSVSIAAAKFASTGLALTRVSIASPTESPRRLVEGGHPRLSRSGDINEDCNKDEERIAEVHRAIGRIRPHARRRVGLIEQALAQTRALVSGGVARRPFADEAEAAIDRYVALIA